MKKILSATALALLLLAASACLREEIVPAKLSVQLCLPSDLETEVDLSKVTVTLQNKTAPFSYSSESDASGRVEFTVQSGRYDIIASAYFKSTRVAVNGSTEEFVLTQQGLVDGEGRIGGSQVTVNLNVAVPNALVIRELYYHGSSTLDGASYTKDTYLEIYNNSGDGGKTVYLDSLCIAAIFPYNSTTGDNAWAGMDTVAVAQMFWMFPGDGHTYPLAPGESAVVACKAAVDHGARAVSGLELNKAHFGCYSENLTGHEIAAGVVPMVCHMAGQGTAWALSIHSPALVIFEPPMGVAAYRADAERWERYAPGTTSGTKYWHIASKWIIDGVECVDSPQQSVKRLPSTIDASYVYMRSAHYSGKCVTRRLDFVENGIEVFMDTNNSAEDFIPDSAPSPRLKK